MNHYDGPAFYRKYRDYITKEPTSAATSQVAPAQSQPASAAASSAPRSAAAAYSAVSPKRQVASAAATSAEPFNGVTHGDFHPTHIPAQMTRSKAAVGVALQSDKTDYLEVETSLYKPIDSYFLFTTADGSETADAEAAEIDAVAVPVSAAPTVVFSRQYRRGLNQKSWWLQSQL